MASHNALKVRKTIILMVISLLILNGIIVAAAFYYFSYLDTRSKDERNNIVAIVQSCHDKEPLKIAYLAELLRLSVDQPTNLYRFNISEARQRLLNSPIIKNAEIKKIKPGTLDITYSLRSPIAYLSNYSNTAIDEQGIFFPFKPFFTLKNLPEVVISAEIDQKKSVWGTGLKEEDFQLLKSILNMLKNDFYSDLGSLRSIDISKAFATSSGQREIVIVFNERMEAIKSGEKGPVSCVRTLRLPSEDIFHQLANYSVLHKHLNNEIIDAESVSSSQIHQIIDMRIPNLAFIEVVKKI